MQPKFYWPMGCGYFLNPRIIQSRQFLWKLQQKGGYASFPLNQQASARVSPHLVWESGFDRFSCDELTRLLYNQSIEFNYGVDPWYRYILAESNPDSIKTLLELIVGFFEAPKFDPASLKKSRKH